MSTSRKRKAPDQEETPNEKIGRKSKKERLEDARARARKWAMESEQIERTGVATVKSPPVAVNSAAKAAVVTKVGPTAQKDVKSPAKRLSLEQRKAEARARAKAWAAADEAITISAKHSRGNTPTKEQSTFHHDEEDEHSEDEDMEELEAVIAPHTTAPFASPVRSGAKSMTHESYPPSFHENHEHKRPPAPERAPRPLTPTETKQPPPFASPGRPKAKNKTHELISPSFQETQVREQQGKDELKRIRQQVMVNALASSPVPAVNNLDDSHSMPQQQDQAVPFYQDYEYTHPVKESRRSRPYLMCLSFIVVLGAVVAAVINIDLPSVRDVSPPLHPCFVDNYEFADGTNPPKSPFMCDASLERLPCPGKCAGGHLFFCIGEHLTTAPDGSGCILSASANATLAHVVEVLTNLTVQTYCSLEGLDFAHKRAKAPVFPMSKIDGLDVDLVVMSRDFVVEAEEGLIGLSDEYADSKLVLPTMCWFSLLTVDILMTLIASSMHTLKEASVFLFRVGKTFPFLSAVCFIVLIVTVQLRRRHAQQKKLLTEIAETRQLAYERLMQDASVEHVVLHLRDGIALDLYPTSKRSRVYLITKVWPRVVADVRLDNRVRKTSRRMEGKPREVWQWVANKGTGSSVKFQT